MKIVKAVALIILGFVLIALCWIQVLRKPTPAANVTTPPVTICGDAGCTPECDKAIDPIVFRALSGTLSTMLDIPLDVREARIAAMRTWVASVKDPCVKARYVSYLDYVSRDASRQRLTADYEKNIPTPPVMK